MNVQLLDFLADPTDGGALQLHPFSGKANQIRIGVLNNPLSVLLEKRMITQVTTYEGVL